MKPPAGEERTGGSLSAHGSTSMPLIRRVKDADPEAWNRLVRLYTPLVFYWCHQAGLSQHDTADVAQEVFRSLSGAIGSFRHDQVGDTFRGWLRTICRNKILDHVRCAAKFTQGAGGTTHQKWIAGLADDPPATAPEGINSPENSAPFSAAIELVRNEFESRTWTAFWRTAIDDQPANRVAEELGMSHAAVRKAKSRVIKRLREELASPLDEEDRS